MSYRYRDKRLSGLPSGKVPAARRELGLGETATYREIASAYRRLAMRWHPDVCPESDAEDCKECFARITAAKHCLVQYVSNYRHSFRAADIKRDQESPEQQVLWRFKFHPGRPEEKDEAGESEETSLAGNVRRAANILGVGETASVAEIRHAYRRLVLLRHPDRLPPDGGPEKIPVFQDIQRAYQILTRYVESYRYSFRPEDIRRDQEGPMEHHIRQFGRDPSWEL